MTDDLRNKIEGLSEEEAKAWLSEQIAEGIRAFKSIKPMRARDYWDLCKRMGPSPDMAATLQDALERGVRFHHPNALTDDDDSDLFTVKAIWDACCDTDGHIAATETAPIQHLVVKLTVDKDLIGDPE